MKILDRVKNWWISRKDSRSVFSEPLREFVYLDEVSVYSLLASRKQGIIKEFTETHTASLNSELSSSIRAGLPGLGSNLDGKSQSFQTQASQVVRKAIVQTSFKELYELEKGNLYLSNPCLFDLATIESVSDIEKHLEALIGSNLVVDVDQMKRGDLLEAKIELEADPLFHMTSFITTLYEIMGDSEDAFGSLPVSQVREAHSIGQVLERLLSGLVPVKGRIVDFESMRLGDKEVLIHQSLKEKLNLSIAESLRPVYVTGVADRGLFWKDTRQILFSGARYNVLCRLASEGLMDDWQPVKVSDMFRGVVPDFEEVIGSFSKIARDTMEGRARVEGISEKSDDNPGIELAKRFVCLLEKFHQKRVSSDTKEYIAASIVPTGNWHLNVLERRKVLDEVTNLVEEELELETPGDVRLSLRQKALASMEVEVTNTPTPFAPGSGSTSDARSARFIDTEFVAVYW